MGRNHSLWMIRGAQRFKHKQVLANDHLFSSTQEWSLGLPAHDDKVYRKYEEHTADLHT